MRDGATVQQDETRDGHLHVPHRPVDGQRAAIMAENRVRYDDHWHFNLLDRHLRSSQCDAGFLP